MQSEHVGSEPPEEEHAGQAAQQRKEPQAAFRKADEIDDQPLGPEEEQGGDLTIIKRLQQIRISAANEVHRQEAFI